MKKRGTVLSKAFWALESIYTTLKCTALTYLQSHLVRLPILIGKQKEKRLWSDSRLHYKLLHHLGLMILQIQWYLTSPWLQEMLYWASEKHPYIIAQTCRMLKQISCADNYYHFEKQLLFWIAAGLDGDDVPNYGTSDDHVAWASHHKLSVPDTLSHQIGHEHHRSIISGMAYRDWAQAGAQGTSK